MKKSIKICLFIIALFVIIGLKKSYAVEDPFISKEEYVEKYGNQVLVLAREDGNIINNVFARRSIKIGNTFKIVPVMIDVDELLQTFGETMETARIIDFKDLKITNQVHPNIVEGQNGEFTAIAEGSYAFSCSYEENGVTYDAVDFFNAGGLEPGEKFWFEFTPNEGVLDASTCSSLYSNFGDSKDSYVTIDNTRMVLTKENNSDKVIVEGWNDTSFDYDGPNGEFIFEWSIDDESIVSIEKIEENPNDIYRLWKSTQKVTAKKNGTTKIRCRISTEIDNGEIGTIEKVIDVTVTGFDEENTNNEENNENKETSSEEGQDETVANKPLANTGEQFKKIGFIGVLIIISIVMIKRYSKYSSKEIK